jgi:sarcosine oxidase, subunit gamma
MAEPARRSPLAGAAVAERRVPGPEPVALAALPFRGKLVLRGGGTAVHGPVARALGVELPGPLCGASAGGTAALWLGPDEWLVLTEPDAGDQLAAALREALAGTHHAVVMVSDRMTGIGVSGGRARDVLNAGCPLDLHPSAFPPGSVTRTLLGKATVVLRRPVEAEAFELWVNGSFAPYVWLFLENAAREFGIDIAA